MTYAAIAMSVNISPSAGWLAILETLTVLCILFAGVTAITGSPTTRPFWIGFAIVSGGWLWLHYPGAGLSYSVPDMLSNWISDPEQIPYYWEPLGSDADSSFSAKSIYIPRQLSAQFIAAFVFGLLGGFFAQITSQQEAAAKRQREKQKDQA